MSAAATLTGNSAFGILSFLHPWWRTLSTAPHAHAQLAAGSVLMVFHCKSGSLHAAIHSYQACPAYRQPKMGSCCAACMAEHLRAHTWQRSNARLPAATSRWPACAHADAQARRSSSELWRAGAHRLLQRPGADRHAQLLVRVREEAHAAAAALALRAQLRAVLARVQVALVHAVRVRALVALRIRTCALSPPDCVPAFWH